MTDTSPDVEIRMRQLWMSRSPDERIRAACEMFDLAREILIAGIRAEQPGIAPEELRVKIFERTYGGDFEPDLRARIIGRLRAERQ